MGRPGMESAGNSPSKVVNLQSAGMRTIFPMGREGYLALKAGTFMRETLRTDRAMVRG
jgi:hypothetical protein